MYFSFIFFRYFLRNMGHFSQLFSGLLRIVRLESASFSHPHITLSRKQAMLAQGPRRGGAGGLVSIPHPHFGYNQTNIWFFFTNVPITLEKPWHFYNSKICPSLIFPLACCETGTASVSVILIPKLQVQTRLFMLSWQYVLFLNWIPGLRENALGQTSLLLTYFFLSSR